MPRFAIARLARAGLMTAATVAMLSWGGEGKTQGMRGGGPTEVGVVTLESAQVPFSQTVPGRAVAFQEVDIRPRVGGMISEVVYEYGRPVSAGDVLFRIEDDTYRAQLSAAQAAVDLAEASVATSQSTITRYERLLGTGITEDEMASARVSLKQAEADLSSAQANLEVARLDLDRTEIRSPIDGFPSVPTVSVGTLVTEAQTDALATVTRLDPIYVDVVESSRRIGEIRNRFDSGSLTRGDRLGLNLQLETGETHSGEGSVVSPSASVSTTTGSSELRLQFDNPERRIMPGQYLRVEMTLGTTQAVLVPQGATSRSSAGELTAFVAVNGAAHERVLTEDGSYRNDWVVTDGVEDGELLIVDGLSNLQDGAEVSTVPVTISDDGVVSDVAQDGADAGSADNATASDDGNGVTSGDGATETDTTTDGDEG
ncbi:RND transporter [Salipiger pallidus]|uniref:RND transporter n=1 Tax=Salipiger pallidus TaxID=1775170 RepID=A0A8J2ZHD5_9RHOB|nr:efflux RND transporter periplasmic adaptor subunit [Salipiger pallidus]GGG62680.1 RND transporter [Salipiger pallidus]